MFSVYKVCVKLKRHETQLQYKYVKGLANN